MSALDDLITFANGLDLPEGGKWDYAASELAQLRTNIMQFQERVEHYQKENRRFLAKLADADTLAGWIDQIIYTKDFDRYEEDLQTALTEYRKVTK
jgi:hypothetical protein